MALGIVAPATIGAHAAPAVKPNILLIHGGFADGSSWHEETRRLQHDGYTKVASQSPSCGGILPRSPGPRWWPATRTAVQ